jgi:hypothetical protein
MSLETRLDRLERQAGGLDPLKQIDLPVLQTMCAYLRLIKAAREAGMTDPVADTHTRSTVERVLPMLAYKPCRD